jgi:hypothetical protein
MKCDGCRWAGVERVCNACKKTDDRSAVPAPHVERAPRHAPVEKKESAGLDSLFSGRVRISINSRRNRLCDADGISAKAVIDGLVIAGVLENDSPEFVESVSYSQEKAKVEETIVTIEEVYE